MSVFNSLGSNYDLSFVLKSLSPEVAKLAHLRGGITSENFTEKLVLKNFLEKKYDGKAVLLFKGREAITLALQTLNLPRNSQVAISGFTCYAVYKAIEEAGCKPVLIDIPKDDLNFTRSDLARVVVEDNIKVIIVQNTLGYPCDIEGISKICKEKNIILIEDLAHSVGAKYKNNKEAGGIGDFVILSFSQDKIIDGVSGGALIVRRPRRLNAQNLRGWENKNPPLRKQFLDRLYLILTWKIRKTYDFGIGNVLHFILKNLGLLSAPMDDLGYGLTNLPNFYQNLAQKAFDNLKDNLNHRRKIAKIYVENLNQKIMFRKINSQINNSSNLRFPVFVKNREELIEFLKSKGFHLSDIWYDAPIAPKRFMKKINYKNDCPNAELISDLILNLPTHKNISEKQALYLSKLINEWLK
ncbi:MAG: aminotransferase class I/II-fold pyridoxal phosphate-dependent enzyme [Patescibacteria group bacterium]